MSLRMKRSGMKQSQGLCRFYILLHSKVYSHRLTYIFRENLTANIEFKLPYFEDFSI